MNTSDFDTPSMHDDDRFDAHARQVHASAQDALSPRVRAQLQQRRRAVLAGPRPAHGMRWGPMLTMAATLALAVGLGLRLWSPAAVKVDTDAPATSHGGPTRVSGTQSGAGADAALDTTAGTTAGPASRPDAQSDARAPALAAAGGDMDGQPSSGPAVAGNARDPRAAAPSTSRLDADLDAIAALLAAPLAGERDTTGDAAGADIAQDDALLATLDESPDFYLWLAGDDDAGTEAL